MESNIILQSPALDWMDTTGTPSKYVSAERHGLNMLDACIPGHGATASASLL
jgi:hypothetical protein